MRDSARVPRNLDGSHRHPERFSRRFAGQVLRARKALDELPPVVRLHDLRPTHATLLLADGVPVKVVARVYASRTVERPGASGDEGEWRSAAGGRSGLLVQPYNRARRSAGAARAGAVGRCRSSQEDDERRTNSGRARFAAPGVANPLRRRR